MIRSNKNGFTLVEVMIAVSIISLLAAIAIPQLIAMKQRGNEILAKSNIRSLMTAAEVMMATKGHYPTNFAEFKEFMPTADTYCWNLTGWPNPYLTNGYIYTCETNASGYTFVAYPTTPGTSGNVTYTATSGGVLTPL